MYKKSCFLETHLIFFCFYSPRKYQVILQLIVPTHVGRKAWRKVSLGYFRGANTPTQYSALYPGSTTSTTAELSQHHAAQGEAPPCHSTAFSPGLCSLKALYALLQSLHVYLFATAVNPPGTQVPDRIFTFLHLSPCSEGICLHSHAKLQVQ